MERARSALLAVVREAQMQARDYRLLAKVLSTVKQGPEKAEIVMKLGMALMAENSRFSYEKFRAACNGGRE